MWDTVMEISADPYEQKLYHMFNSHDVEKKGSLDQEALSKLCKTLELKDTGRKLVKCLLNDNQTKAYQKNRVTFKEFKEGLLNFLGNEMADSERHPSVSSISNDDDDEEDNISSTTLTMNNKSGGSGLDSPAREVSPKFIVGSKKYGRRSRPSSSELCDTSLSDSDNETVVVKSERHLQKPHQQQPQPQLSAKINKTQKVQRSASQSDIHGNKRRRPVVGTKLKRCASLPAQRNIHKKDLNAVNTTEQMRKQLESSAESLGNLDFENLSHNLYEMWNSFDVGEENYLNRSQLELVIERVGLQKIATKVAEEVFEKLNISSDKRISFHDFISLIQNDTGMINSENGNDFSIIQSIEQDSGCCNIDDTSTKADNLVNDADYAPESSIVPADVIVDMWEAAGIIHAQNLLINLGFTDDQVQISHLSASIEEELQALRGEAATTPLLRASLALHKAEVNGLQVALRQLAAENRKLHSDNRDTNRRAALLAQEVDERHATIENSARSEIRALEQRHNEIVRELTAQLATDRENWTNLNAKLEERIKNFESEEAKLRSENIILLEENSALESEQTSLQKQLTELLETNIKLNNEIADLEDRYNNQETRKSDAENEEVLELIDKITLLQIENADLRDKNDELCADIEGVTNELNKLRATKKSHHQGPPNRSMSNVEISTVGNESASDESITTLEGEQNAYGSNVAVKRRGDSPSKTRVTEESPRLGKFRKCSNDNNSGDSETSGDWMALNTELGQTMTVVTTGSTSGFSQDFSSLTDSGINKEEELKQLKAKVADLEKIIVGQGKIEQMETQPKETMVKIEKIMSERDKYREQCLEYEASLELMRKEFDNCEDYWQSKLNEERQLYEEEQRISDEKFNELLRKMTEYEEQFTSSDKDGRLTPIEEKCQLEQQYTELEAEIDELKANNKKILMQKSEEIETLQVEIKKLHEKLGEKSDQILCSPPRNATPESLASSPISYLWHQSTIQAPARDYHNPNWNGITTKAENEGYETVTQKLSGIECLSTTNTTIMSTTGPETWTVEDDGNQENIIRTISPIQKPPATKLKTAQVDGANDGGENADAISVTSGKSSGSHSVASTYSIHKTSLPNSTCPSPNGIKEDIKRLKLLELQLHETIKELAHKRDCLMMELQQLSEVKPFLEKAYARTTHPNLTQKIQQLEQKNRHLQNVLRQQHHYTESIMHQTWQQQRAEISELRNRLEAQSIIIAEQAQRLANADLLVKDLYVENSHLTANIQRLEQQKSRTNLIFQHQAAGISGVPSLP